MSTKIMVPLTTEQREALRPFFDAIKEANMAHDDGAAIGAQVYEDGIVCKVFTGLRGAALSKALGGQWTTTHKRAAERMNQKDKDPIP